MAITYPRDNTRTASIVQEPHTPLLAGFVFSAAVDLAFISFVAILNPVGPDEVEPGPYLFNDLIQGLLMFLVVARRLIAVRQY